MKKIIIVFVTVIVLLASTNSKASITQTYGAFDVTFYNDGDSSTYGYTGAQDWTAEQMADVGASIQAWSSSILNVPGRQIQMHVYWNSFSGTILGGSYSPSNGDGTTSWNYGEHVWRDGVNYSGPTTAFDTVIRYDIDAATYDWNFGSDAPTGSQIDFRSVVTHEIGHSLGWTDTFYTEPYDDWGNTWGTSSDPFGYAGFNGLSQWDQNLLDSSGNRPENGGDGIPSDFNQLDNPVYWDGPNAFSYYGSNVPIYAPSTFAPGSSLAHLDQSTFPYYLMSPSIYLGTMNRTVSPLEWAMMMDMGWTIVPVPGAVILGILGLGVVGVKLRKYA